MTGWLFAVVSARAATAEQLYQAMGVDPAEVSSALLDSPLGANDVLASLGIIQPTSGPDMAVITSGKVGVSPQDGFDHNPNGEAGDRSTLTLELTAPATANSMKVDFYFLSAEFPEWVGSAYNDKFTLFVTGSAFTGNAAIDVNGNPVNINSVLFDVTAAADLAGTGFGGIGGGTGWLSSLIPVDPNDTVTLTFDIADQADGFYDSLVLLDNFQWATNDVDTPTIVEDLVVVDFLSPKRGTTLGGESTLVYGSAFEPGCVARFDGLDATTAFLDSGTLETITPAHAVGLVDIEVACPDMSVTLLGGYTYYTTEGGDAGPAIAEVSPYVVPIAGGPEVRVDGSGFDVDTTVQVDGAQVEATFVDASAITFAAPAHAEGLVDVEVIDGSGLADLRSGALLYVGDPAEAVPGSSTGADESSDGSAGAGARTTGCAVWPPGGSAAWSVVGLAAFAARRRRA